MPSTAAAPRRPRESSALTVSFPPTPDCRLAQVLSITFAIPSVHRRQTGGVQPDTVGRHNFERVSARSRRGVDAPQRPDLRLSVDTRCNQAVAGRTEAIIRCPPHGDHKRPGLFNSQFQHPHPSGVFFAGRPRRLPVTLKLGPDRCPVMPQGGQHWLSVCCVPYPCCRLSSLAFNEPFAVRNEDSRFANRAGLLEKRGLDSSIIRGIKNSSLLIRLAVATWGGGHRG